MIFFRRRSLTEAVVHIERALDSGEVDSLGISNFLGRMRSISTRRALLHSMRTRCLLSFAILRRGNTRKLALVAERASLAQRVEERTAALRETNNQLVAALRTRDEFLATVSHELRTPLTAILAFADLMQRQVYGPLNERQRAGA